MADRVSWATSPATAASMRSNRGRDTGPELAIRRRLHAAGLRYFVNRRPIPTLRRTADIVFPRIKLAVFVDGCFWHGCPIHHTIARANGDYWKAKVEANRRRDAETNRVLREHGWVVLRFWEHENPDQVVEAVATEVDRLRGTPTRA